jgi:hypothetical protein
MDVLRLRSSAGAIRSIDVCDLSGRSVPVRVASAHGAEVLLDVHMLAQGPYVLRALDTSGTMHHARFTIH